VLFEALEFGVRVEKRVPVVEPGHVAEINDAVLHPVNPAAAVCVGVGRIAERVRHTARRISVVGQLPKLFDAETVDLRLAPVVEVEPLGKLLDERAARPFAEHRHLRHDVHARLEIRSRLSFPVHTLIARADAYDAVGLVVEHLRAGEFGEDVDARLLALLAEPSRQLIQRDDVVTVILERRRRNRRLDGAGLCQVEEKILVDRSFERRALLRKIRHQLLESLRVHNRARKYVRADVCALLDDGYLNVAERLALSLALRDRLVVASDEPRQMKRPAQIRRARADEQHVHLDTFTFHEYAPLKKTLPSGH
jgi:hypothetical protein